MATLIVAKTYSDTQILFEADLDAMKSSIETFTNTTKLNDDNLQPSSITGSLKVAPASVSTANLNALAVTGPGLASASVTTAKIQDASITSDKVDNLAVTNAKIAANGIARRALPALNSAISPNPLTILSSSPLTSIVESSSPLSDLFISQFTPQRSNWPVFVTLIGDLVTEITTPSAGTPVNIDTVITLYQDGTPVSRTAHLNTVVPNNAAFTNYKAESSNIHTFVLTNLTAGQTYSLGLNFFLGSAALRLTGTALQVFAWELP